MKALPLLALTCSLCLLGADLPGGAGKEPFERICSTCHQLEMATSVRKSKEDWANTVDDMVSRGADGTREDIAKVIDYLATNFGLKPPKSEVAKLRPR